MKHSISRLIVSATVAVVAVLIESAPAMADAPTSTAESAPDAMQEIVVTAQRRAQSISDVPVSISAYDRAALDNLGARNVSDIARTTPGVIVRSGFEGTTSIAIRGVSSSVGASTTGIYIDDTPIQVRALGAGGVATSAFPRVFDLERVEVLRGPQGTLFGSGSEGGTIRFITPAPSLDHTSAYARSEIGFTDGGEPTYELGMAFGAPIVTDEIGFRASVYGRNEGGWVERAPYPQLTPISRNVNSNTALVANLAFAFKPTADLTITPAVFFQREHSQDVAQYWPQLSRPSRAQFVSGQLMAQPTTDRLTLPSLKLQWDLASVSLFSNTSYINRSRDLTGDYSFIITEVFTGDFDNLRVLSPTAFSNPQTAFTQEVRLQSRASDSRISWQVGAFYQESKQEASQLSYSPDLGQLTSALFGLTTLEAFGVDLYQGNMAYSGVDSSKDSQTALFGNASFRINAAWSLDGGVRVAHTKYSFTNSQNGPFNGGASSSSGSASGNPVSPKIGLNYKPNSDLLVYLSAAKGFRSGGANTSVSAQACADDLQSLGLTQAPSTYSSDSTWSYELGSKLKAANGHLQLDASVFYVDWRNIQSLVPLLHCGFQFVGNLGNAVSKGFDVQSTLQISGGFIVKLGVGYTQAQYDKTLEVAPGTPLVTKGDRLDTPPWHVSAAIDYAFAVSSDLPHGYAHVQYDSDSGYDLQHANDVTYDGLANRVAATRLVSARVGVRTGRWDASLYVDNALNSYDRTSFFHDVPTSGLLRYTAFRPRSVGLSAIYKF